MISELTILIMLFVTGTIIVPLSFYLMFGPQRFEKREKH